MGTTEVVLISAVVAAVVGALGAVFASVLGHLMDED